MQPQTARMTYRMEEVAKLLGIGRNQAYEAAKTGQIPTLRVGKRLLVPKVAFDRMLNGGDEATPPSTPKFAG